MEALSAQMGPSDLQQPGGRGAHLSRRAWDSFPNFEVPFLNFLSLKPLGVGRAPLPPVTPTNSSSWFCLDEGSQWRPGNVFSA